MRIILLYSFFSISFLFSAESLEKEIAIMLEEHTTLHQEIEKFSDIKEELKQIEEKLQAQLSHVQGLLEKEQKEAFSKQNEQLERVRREIVTLEQEMARKEEIRKELIQLLQIPGTDQQAALFALRSNQKEIESIIVTQNNLLSTHNHLLAQQEQVRKKMGENKHTSHAVGFFGEYLYWKVRQNGLDIIGKGTLTPGNVQDVEFDMDSGFRVGIQYHIDEKWGLEGSYLYFSPDGKQSASLGEEELFFTRLTEFTAQGFQISPLQNITANDDLSSANSSITLRMHFYDLNLRREMLHYESFQMDFLFGLLAAYLKEQLNISYDGVGRIDIAEVGQPLERFSFPFHLQTTDICCFGGGGAYLGCKGIIPLWKETSFFAVGKANLTMGRYDLKSNSAVETGTTGNPSVATVEQLYRDFRTFKSVENYFGMNYLFHIRAGLSWQHPFGKNNCFSLAASYEGFLWLAIARFKKGIQGSTVTITEAPTLQAIASNSSISFIDQNHVGVQGLVVSSGIRF